MIETSEVIFDNQHADETVNSNYPYPRDYKNPSNIEDQIRDIILLFGLDGRDAFSCVKKLPKLLDGAEGRFAVPKISVLAKKHFPDVKEFSHYYCKLIQLACKKLAESRHIVDQTEGKISVNNLRMNKDTLKFINALEEKQTGDILIIDAQLGMKHRGKSARLAKAKFSKNELGMCIFHAICILLTNPKRVSLTSELDMICVGDEIFNDKKGTFSDNLIFNMCEFNQLEIGLNDESWPQPYLAAASVFDPCR